MAFQFSLLMLLLFTHFIPLEVIHLIYSHRANKIRYSQSWLCRELKSDRLIGTGIGFISISYYFHNHKLAINPRVNFNGKKNRQIYCLLFHLRTFPRSGNSLT
jgi:hypothetical protein